VGLPLADIKGSLWACFGGTLAAVPDASTAAGVQHRSRGKTSGHFLSRPVTWVYMSMVMTMDRNMTRHIKASEFKAKCLALMDEVARTGNPLLITKNGKPVAELVPQRSRRRNLKGCSKDSFFIIGDIVSPIDVEWDAIK
jgi:prevent-host-death family protein